MDTNESSAQEIPVTWNRRSGSVQATQLGYSEDKSQALIRHDGRMHWVSVENLGK